ncbi:MAG: helix-turn-helix domain-containing protein [Candidatus Limnocylindria bacterium]
MANRQSRIGEAARLAEWVLREIGRELRVARILAGMTQAQVAAILHTSISHVSRVENGLIKGITLPELFRHAAVVGQKPYIKLFPLVARPMDHAQLALFARFRERIDRGWRVIVEAPMPIAGDLRAADALLIIPTCRCVVEVITRLADLQAQLRSARRKVRELEADRLIFVVLASETNRRAVHDAGRAADDAFPIRTKLALQRLTDGLDPGGDCLIFL